MDSEFFVGEKINVGTVHGVIDEIDQFALVIVFDSDGLPEKRWFPMHLISKTRKS